MRGNGQYKRRVRRVHLTVGPFPLWLDAARLLAPASLRDAVRTSIGEAHERMTLDVEEEVAATIAARLRGLGIDGGALEVFCDPPLSRARVRGARLEDARARRDTTPGFTRREAHATGEGRYSLTPEALALALGKRARVARVVDACCGSGGNAIGFARAGARVTAIEIDPDRAEEARHNAAVYGVTERVAFVVGDAVTHVANHEADLLFIDPPWGEQYDKRACTLSDLPLLSALLALDLKERYPRVWLKVPASFRTSDVPGARASAWFGDAAGDAQRIKFVLLELGA